VAEVQKAMKLDNENLAQVIWVLSIIVILQAGFILKYFTQQNILEARRFREAQQQSLSQEVETEINLQAEIEEKAFQEEFIAKKGAELRLLSVGPASVAGLQAVELWLQAFEPVKSVDAVIDFEASELEIIDQIRDIEGVQVAFGDGELYLKNDVRNEEIMITVLFEEEFRGELLLGTIYLRKLAAESSLKFDYTENLKLGSFVTGWESGANILIKPEDLTL
jgi:hypothetical protein